MVPPVGRDEACPLDCTGEEIAELVLADFQEEVNASEMPFDVYAYVYGSHPLCYEEEIGAESCCYSVMFISENPGSLP